MKRDKTVVPGCTAGMRQRTIRMWVMHFYGQRKATQVREHVHSCDPCARYSAEIYGLNEMVIDAMRWHAAMQDKVLAYVRKELPTNQIPEVLEHLLTCGECPRLHSSGVLVRVVGRKVVSHTESVPARIIKPRHPMGGDPRDFRQDDHPNPKDV